MAVCCAVTLFSVVYTWFSRDISVLAVYFLITALIGMRLVKSVVAYVDEGQLVSVNWRGVVSSVALLDMQRATRTRYGFKFRDRYYKWWSVYLGEASPTATDQFVQDLKRYVANVYPGAEWQF